MIERKVVILGAGGRDYHNFNREYRDDPNVRVVAFTATQIPGIDDRRYPADLAGPAYPDGIPIRPESALEAIIDAHEVSDVVLWDGGDNDFPCVRPDLHIVVVDALRPDQLLTHHPGTALVGMADLFVINKVDAAGEGPAGALATRLRALRPEVTQVRAASPVVLDDPDQVAGRRVLVVDDGPTITHGGMGFGAGHVAAARVPGVTIVDPRDSASPAIAEVCRAYPHIGPVLPAVGYDANQRAALAETIERSAAEVVVAGTPIDFARVVPVDRPVVRARYGFADAGEPTLFGEVETALQALRSRIATGR